NTNTSTQLEHITRIVTLSPHRLYQVVSVSQSQVKYLMQQRSAPMTAPPTSSAKANLVPVGSVCGEGNGNNVCDASSICVWPYAKAVGTCVTKPTVLPTNATCVTNEFCGSELQAALCPKDVEKGTYLEPMYYCQPKPSGITPQASAGASTAVEAVKTVVATIVATTKGITSAAEHRLICGI
ncbi:hypothetical protein HDU99_006512, partial [Rhizoclosmatium hyalinum]